MLRGSAGAITVGEGVELLDIAERQSRLPLNPGPQPRLQRTMGELERPGGQGALILDREHARFAVGDGYQHRDQIGRDVMLGLRRRRTHVYPGG